MKIIVRTAIGSLLQTTKLMGLPFQLVPNTTLNEKFAIQAGVAPDASMPPSMRYFCIGNGGHRNMTGTDGRPYTSPIQHSPKDFALYNHLPFLLRTPTDDLTVTERQNYALRKQIVVDGSNYIAYYLKRLVMTGISPQMTQSKVVDGDSTTTPFVPDSSNLNPVAPVIPPVGVTSTDGDYVSVSAVLSLNFSANDVAELINVANILYGNELMAVISEIGLVSGSDKVVTGSGSGGSSFNYNECVAAQIATLITGYYAMSFTNKGFDFGVEVGATEPLFGLQDGN